jgi:hypothetical protein
MAQNNLRIVYQNLADYSTSTITASSTASVATPTTNLKLDSKSLVWRSATSATTTVKANLLVAFAATSMVGNITLPFCNLTSTATIRVRGFSGATPILGDAYSANAATAVNTNGATLVFDTGIITACPYQVLGLWDWGALPLGVNSYSYGGGTYARSWLTNQLGCSNIVIELVDTNTDKYIEASRLVVGTYWSPKYNTSYGLSTSIKDLTTNQRRESGDLITTRGIRYKSMAFDLKYLTPSDRLQFERILKGNGLAQPIFISLFPNNSGDYDKEQAHQIYGKLSQLSEIQHPMFDIYSTQIEIEEI